MAESTVTLATLRRAIAAELNMPFARRFTGGTSTVDTGTTTSTIIDAALKQKDGFWDASWFYHPTTQGISPIWSYVSNTSTFQLETAMSSISVGDTYEIHSIYNAEDIRRAINRAINNASRVFFNSVVDTTLVLQENVLSYSLTGLTSRMWLLNHVRLENKPSVMQGTLVSATSTTFVVTGDLDDFTPAANYMIGIYDGTGSGQQRALASVSNSTGTVTAWTTTPDSTSKYVIWDTTYEVYDWIDFSSFRTDAKEYPSTLYLTKRMPSLFGKRIMLEYLAVPAELTAEADTTIVPSEYIVPKAISILYGQRISGTRVDRDTRRDEAQRYDSIAETYLVRNIPQKPDVTLRNPIQSDIYIEDDPLAWHGGS